MEEAFPDEGKAAGTSGWIAFSADVSRWWIPGGQPPDPRGFRLVTKMDGRGR